MADIIGQETWSADGKSYIIKVTEPGATVTENAISIVSPVRLRRGGPNYSPLRPTIESQLEFTIKDTGKLFRAAINGKAIGDIVIEFTEDAVVLFKGYVLPDFQRYRAYKANPDYRVSAYDGIAGLKGITYDKTTDETLRTQLFNISNKIGLSLQLNTIFETKHDGADASTDPPDAVRLRMENLLPEGGSYHDALLALCKFYNAQFFQQGGQWFFVQRSERGASMTNYPTDSSGTPLTNATVDYIVDLNDGNMHRDGTFISQYPPSSRIVSRHKYPDYLLRNADWSEGAKFWDSSGGDQAGTNGRRLTVNNATLKQIIGQSFLISSGAFDQFTISFQYWFNVVSGTGSHDVDYLEIKAVAADGTTRYANSAGAWNATQDYISQNIDFTSHTLQGAFTLAVISSVMPFEPMRIEITLFFDKDASGDMADLDYMEVGPITVAHLKPDPDDDVVRPTQFETTQETGELGDEDVEEFTIGDTDTSFFGPGVLEYYDGTDWLPSGDWDGAGQKIHELRAIGRKNQVDERLKGLEPDHKFGDVVDIHNAFAYDDNADDVGEIYIPTFAEIMFFRSGKRHTRTSSLQLLDATKVNVNITTMYWGDSDGNIKKATIDTESVPWSASTVWTIGSGRVYRTGKVDQINGLIFTLEVHSGSDTNYLVKRNLDGTGSPEDLLSWDTSGTDPQAWQMGLRRLAQNVAVDLQQSPSAGNNHEVKSYDYDGTFVETLITRSGRSKAQAITFDHDEEYMVIADTLGSSGLLLRVKLSDSSTINLVSPYAQSTSGETNDLVIDEADGKCYHFGVTGGTSELINYVTFPGGSAETSWKTNTDGVNQRGMAIHRSLGRIMYPTGTAGDIAWDTYAETDEETIFDGGGGSPPDIVWIDTGFN